MSEKKTFSVKKVTQTTVKKEPTEEENPNKLKFFAKKPKKTDEAEKEEKEKKKERKEMEKKQEISDSDTVFQKRLDLSKDNNKEITEQKKMEKEGEKFIETIREIQWDNNDASQIFEKGISLLIENTKNDEVFNQLGKALVEKFQKFKELNYNDVRKLKNYTKQFVSVIQAIGGVGRADVLSIFYSGQNKMLCEVTLGFLETLYNKNQFDINDVLDSQSQIMYQFRIFDIANNTKITETLKMKKYSATRSVEFIEQKPFSNRSDDRLGNQSLATYFIDALNFSDNNVVKLFKQKFGNISTFNTNADSEGKIFILIGFINHTTKIFDNADEFFRKVLIDAFKELRKTMTEEPYKILKTKIFNLKVNNQYFLSDQDKENIKKEEMEEGKKFEDEKKKKEQEGIDIIEKVQKIEWENDNALGTFESGISLLEGNQNKEILNGLGNALVEKLKEFEKLKYDLFNLKVYTNKFVYLIDVIKDINNPNVLSIFYSGQNKTLCNVMLGFLATIYETNTIDINTLLPEQERVIQKAKRFDKKYRANITETLKMKKYSVQRSLEFIKEKLNFKVNNIQSLATTFIDALDFSDKNVVNLFKEKFGDLSKFDTNFDQKGNISLLEGFISHTVVIFDGANEFFRKVLMNGLKALRQVTKKETYEELKKEIFDIKVNNQSFLSNQDKENIKKEEAGEEKAQKKKEEVDKEKKAEEKRKEIEKINWSEKGALDKWKRLIENNDIDKDLVMRKIKELSKLQNLDTFKNIEAALVLTRQVILHVIGKGYSLEDNINIYVETVNSLLINIKEKAPIDLYKQIFNKVYYYFNNPLRYKMVDGIDVIQAKELFFYPLLKSLKWEGNFKEEWEYFVERFDVNKLRELFEKLEQIKNLQKNPVNKFDILFDSATILSNRFKNEDLTDGFQALFKSFFETNFASFNLEQLESAINKTKKFPGLKNVSFNFGEFFIEREKIEQERKKQEEEVEKAEEEKKEKEEEKRKKEKEEKEKEEKKKEQEGKKEEEEKEEKRKQEEKQRKEREEKEKADKKKKEEEEKKKKEQEEKEKKEKEEKEKKEKKEQEEKEKAEKKRKQEEEERIKKQKEEEEKRKQEAEKQRKKEEEEKRKKEEADKKKKEEEQRKKKEQEEEKRKLLEEVQKLQLNEEIKKFLNSMINLDWKSEAAVSEFKSLFDKVQNTGKIARQSMITLSNTKFDNSIDGFQKLETVLQYVYDNGFDTQQTRDFCQSRFQDFLNTNDFDVENLNIVQAQIQEFFKKKDPNMNLDATMVLINTKKFQVIKTNLENIDFTKYEAIIKFKELFEQFFQTGSRDNYIFFTQIDNFSKLKFSNSQVGFDILLEILQFMHEKKFDLNIHNLYKSYFTNFLINNNFSLEYLNTVESQVKNFFGQEFLMGEKEPYQTVVFVDIRDLIRLIDTKKIEILQRKLETLNWNDDESDEKFKELFGKIYIVAREEYNNTMGKIYQKLEELSTFQMNVTKRFSKMLRIAFYFNQEKMRGVLEIFVPYFQNLIDENISLNNLEKIRSNVLNTKKEFGDLFENFIKSLDQKIRELKKKPKIKTKREKESTSGSIFDNPLPNGVTFERFDENEEFIFDPNPKEFDKDLNIFAYFKKRR